MTELNNITVTTATQILVITEVDRCYRKSLFVANLGDQDAVIKVFGSPSGIQTGDKRNETGTAYTAAEIGLHYVLCATLNVAAANNGYVDLTDYIHQYFKITAVTNTGTTTINYRLQKNYDMVG